MHEQRVAARAAREHAREAVGQRRRRVALLEVGGDRRGRERSDRQLLAQPAHAELARELRDGRVAGGPERAEQQQPGRLAPAQQRGEQVERGVVGPVQVLEHQHDRHRRADGVERLEHLAQHARARRALGALAGGLRLLAFAQQPRQLHQPRRRAARQRRDDRVAGRSARERAERVEHRHVGLARPALGDALADARDGARRRGVVQERVHERALADARLARRQHAGTASRERARQRRAQPRELGLTARRCRGPRLGGGRRGRRGERRVVVEDAALERARGRTRCESQLAQSPGKVAIGGQRLDLASGGVEREHQGSHELLAQRVGGHEPAQLADRLERPAELHQRAGARLLGMAAQVLQPAHLGARELRVGEFAERRAAPERQRAVEQLEGCGRGERVGAAHGALEALRVDLLGRDLEPVSGTVADQQR